MGLHVDPTDVYREGNSVLHRLDARVKAVLALAFILVVSLSPFGAWPAYVLLLSLVVSAALLSEVGMSFVLKRSLLALPFVAAALPLPFTLPGEALASVEVWHVTLTLTLPGLERFLSIAFKSWISMQAAVLLTATTTFPDLLSAMRSLGVPRMLVAIVGLTWRYIFVISDEAVRLMRARAARSGESDARAGGSVEWRARVAGGMMGNLLLRSLDRSDRIYNAMLSRGYDGEARTMPRPHLPGSEIRAGRHDLAVLAGGLLLLALLLGLALIFR